MKTSFGRRFVVVGGTAALAAWLLTFAGSGVALAADQTLVGAHTFASLDGSAQDDDGVADGTFTVNGNLTLDFGASITCNDSGASGASACPIGIHVTGDLVMRAGSKITAENTNDGGSGGHITITVDGDMTMCASAGAQPGCGGASVNPGAIISARKTSGAGDTGDGGDIEITVGDLSTAIGVLYLEGGTTGYGTESGAKILATGPGEAGDITIKVGDTYTSEPGSVVEAGGPTGPITEVQQGGKIYLVAGCEVTTEGRITSKGTDPGADLVHLEGCAVNVRGLVESTGKGHTVDASSEVPPPSGPPFNSCDNNDDSLNHEVIHLDKPFNATGCIEVWGKVVTIDATQGWAGELNADIGDGGTSGEPWIDIYALKSLTVTDGTGNDFERDNHGHDYFSTYAVHANSVDGSDGSSGTVTGKVKSGPLSASGKAFEASSTMDASTGHGTSDEFNGNGSTGGTIDLEASGTVTLDTAWVNASGDPYGGPSTACGGGAGTCGSGGHIVVSAWGTGSDLSWQGGSGDVRPDNTGPNGAGGTSFGGDISLNACDTVDTTGTDFHGELPVITHVCDASKPDLPGYVSSAFGADAETWAICGASTVSGQKFDDQDADGVKDAGEPGLDGWTIHLFNAAGTVHLTQVTAGGGNYTFTGLPPGTYTVCEQLPATSPPWQQTFPTSGADCVSPGDPAADDPTPGPKGYSVDLSGATCCRGQDVTGKDFGNVQLAIKTGIKWDDQANDATAPFEATLDGWTIHLYGTAVNGSAVHKTSVTAGGGVYAFTVLPGSYTVCEELQAGWTQTFPASGADCSSGDPAADNATPGPKGYAITLAEGEIERGNDFANHSQPVSDQPQCQKQTVIDTMNLVYPGNKGPDVTVRTWLGESVQSAVDTVTDAAPHDDGYLIVMVIAHADGSLGGTAAQKVAVDKDYGTTRPFGLFGCSVTLTGGGADPAVWIKSSAKSKQITINGRKTTIFVMDLHGGNSAVGVEADGTYRYLRNEYATGNSGAGIKVVGDYDTVHNGSASGNGGDGIYVAGNYDYLTDTNSMSNAGNGVNLAGSNDTLIKLDVGEKGTGNTLDGIHVVGNTNTLQENDVYANGGDGIDVAGDGNVLTKDVAGDKGKGNAGTGIRVAGNKNNLTENKASTNGADGFAISGATTSANANLLKNNLSNTGTSGSPDYENVGREWRFLGWIKNNGGGNKADGVLLASGVKGLTNFPTSGSTYNYTAVQTAE